MAFRVHTTTKIVLFRRLEHTLLLCSFQYVQLSYKSYTLHYILIGINRKAQKKKENTISRNIQWTKSEIDCSKKEREQTANKQEEWETQEKQPIET